jgi:putative endonuclease
MTRARKAAEERGRWAELIASWWLRAKGYRVLDQRARTAAGEIDLVALRGEYLAFVEVKARATVKAAQEATGLRQQGRIIRAASLWRARYPSFQRYQPRYDLFLVAKGRWPVHHRAAWLPEGPSAIDLI